MKYRDSIFWRKAYLATLKQTVSNAKAKAAADQYIKDYQTRKDVPEFKVHRAVWGLAYFALLGSAPPAKIGDMADKAVEDYAAVIKGQKVVEAAEEEEAE